jgi:hypothetical protein
VLAPVEWRSFITCIVLSLLFLSFFLAAAELPVEIEKMFFPLVGTFGMQTLTAPVNSQKKENKSLSLLSFTLLTAVPANSFQPPKTG